MQERIKQQEEEINMEEERRSIEEKERKRIGRSNSWKTGRKR